MSNGKIASTTIRFGADAAGALSTIAALGRALDGIGARTAGVAKTISGAANNMADRMSAASAAVAPASIAAAGAIGMTTRAAIAQEDSVSNLQKALGGTGNAMQVLQQRLQPIADKLGLSRAATADMAAEMTKANVPLADLAGMLDIAGMSAEAFDMPGAEVAAKLAAIRDAGKLTNSQILELASSFDYLADASSASEKNLLDAYQRVAGLGKSAGLSSDLLLSALTVMQSAGASSEESSTALKNAALPTLKTGGFTKREQAGLDAAGLTGDNLKDFRKAGGSDSVLTQTLERFAAIKDEATRTTAVMDFFGEESGLRILSVVENLDVMKQRYGELRGDMERGRLERTFAIAQQRISFAVSDMQANLSDLGALIGGHFAPHLRTASDLVNRFTRYLDQNPAVANRLAGALAGLAVTAPSLFGLSLAMRGVATAGAAMGAIVAPISLAGRGIAGLVSSLTMTGRAGRLARASMLANVASMARFGAAGLVVAGVGAAVYAAWQPLKKTWAGLFDTKPMKTALSLAGTAFDQLLVGNFRVALGLAKKAWAEAWPELSKRLDQTVADLRATWASFVDWMSGIFPSFRDFDNALGSLGEAVGNLWDAFDKFANSESGRAIGEAIQRLGKQLGDATIKAGAVIVEYLARAINQLADAVERFDAVSAKSGTMAGLKAAFDGLPTTGKILALLVGFRALRMGFRMIMGLGRGVAAPFRAIAGLFGKGGAVAGMTSTFSRLGKIFTGRGLQTAAKLGGKLLVRSLARGALLAIPYVGPILMGAMLAWDIGSMLYDAFKPSIDAAFSSIGQWFLKKWNDWAVTPAKNAWAAITGVVDEQLAYMRDMLRPWGEWISGIWNTYIATPASDAWKAVEGATFSTIEWTTDVLDALGNTIESAFDSVGGSIKETWQTVKDSIGSVFDWIQTKIDAMLESIQSLRDLLPDFGGTPIIPPQADSGSPSTAPANDNAAKQRTWSDWFGYGRPPTDMPKNEAQWKPLEALARALDRLGNLIAPAAKAGEMPGTEGLGNTGDTGKPEAGMGLRNTLPALPADFVDNMKQAEFALTALSLGAMKARVSLRAAGAAPAPANGGAFNPAAGAPAGADAAPMADQASIGELRGIRATGERVATANDNLLGEVSALRGEMARANGTLASINGYASALPGIPAAISRMTPWQTPGGNGAPGAVPKARLDSPVAGNSRVGPI